MRHLNNIVAPAVLLAGALLAGAATAVWCDAGGRQLWQTGSGVVRPGIVANGRRSDDGVLHLPVLRRPSCLPCSARASGVFGLLVIGAVNVR